MALPSDPPAQVTVAVDAMGGDHAPGVVVEGVVDALRRHGSALRVLLTGPEAALREALAAHDAEGLALSTLDAPDVIGMEESPAAAVKTKPRSSIHLGVGAVKQGAAHAFISAGNTGAVMATALLGLGRLEGVARPALPGPFPTVRGQCILLDVGANTDCRPEHLVQFAQMGRIYARAALGIEDPTVGLMNVGEEPSKGNEAAKAAHALLADLDGLNFVGNVEGRDLMHHGADVVVCDGFVGNIVLKFGESIKSVLPALVRREMERLGPGEGPSGDGPPAAAEAAALLQRVLGGITRRFSYEEFGGTPLLGVDGTVLIAHGSSSARAVARAVEVAAEMVRSDVRGAIARALAGGTAA